MRNSLEYVLEILRSPDSAEQPSLSGSLPPSLHCTYIKHAYIHTWLPLWRLAEGNQLKTLLEVTSNHKQRVKQTARALTPLNLACPQKPAHEPQGHGNLPAQASVLRWMPRFDMPAINESHLASQPPSRLEYGSDFQKTIDRS